MTTKKKEEKIKYSYRDILTIHFEVSEYPYDIEDLLNNLTLNFGTVFSTNLEDEALIFDIEIEAEAELDEKISCFLIKLRNVFTIENLVNFKNSEDNISIQKQLLVLFASLSYSSARGILHEKLAFSRYRPNFILPVIKPDKLVEDIDFENIEPIEETNAEEKT